MIRNREDLDSLIHRMDEVGEDKPDYGEMFDFFRLVLENLFEARKSLDIQIKSIGPEEADLRLKEGFPLMDRLRLTPDLASAEDLFERLLDLVEKERDLPPERLIAVRKAREGLEDFREYLLGTFREDHGGESAAGLSGEDQELWRFLLHCALKPSFEAHSLAYRKVLDGHIWEKGYCPSCGGTPAFSGFLEEEGKRMFLCHRCSYVWNFRRVMCPFCENSDHEKLKYIHFEEEPSYRIDVCDNCRGYLKVVDTRKGHLDVILEAEDLVTPHLDLVAVREEYEKKSPNILGM